MNMKQYKYVCVLAEKGSFSKAADELHVSQPSLSQYIKRLENELGIPLVDRSGSEVKLTDAGNVYIKSGAKIIETERQMKQQFSDLSSYNTGSIVVGIAPTRCQYLMPEIVKRFREVYPGMHIVVKERFLGELIDDAEHGEFDLCVATLPVDAAKFQFSVMMREEVILAVPKNMAECQRLKTMSEHVNQRIFPAVDICLIDGCKYVFLTDTQPTQIQLNSFCREFDLNVKAAVKCMSIETQYSMVKAGVGMALIPSSLSKYSTCDSIEYFSIKQNIPYRDMAVIYKKGQYLSEAVANLISIIVSV